MSLPSSDSLSEATGTPSRSCVASWTWPKEPAGASRFLLSPQRFGALVGHEREAAEAENRMNKGGAYRDRTGDLRLAKPRRRIRLVVS